jgi:phage-related protein
MSTGATEESKPLLWMGSSRGDVKDFPVDVRQAVGFALWQAQLGRKHRDAKVLKGFGGTGVLEVVADYDGDTFRAVYTVRFDGAVYVIHAFHKKSKKGIKTPAAALDLSRRRLKEAEAHHEERTAEEDRRRSGQHRGVKRQRVRRLGLQEPGRARRESSARPTDLRHHRGTKADSGESCKTTGNRPAKGLSPHARQARRVLDGPTLSVSQRTWQRRGDRHPTGSPWTTSRHAGCHGLGILTGGNHDDAHSGRRRLKEVEAHGAKRRSEQDREHAPVIVEESSGSVGGQRPKSE